MTFRVSDIPQQGAATSRGTAPEYYPQDLSFIGNLAVSFAGAVCSQNSGTWLRGSADSPRWGQALAGALGGCALWADISQLSSVTPCLFKADSVAVIWTMSAMYSVNYWSSGFWVQCPVEHCACRASHFHQSNASIWGNHF